MMKFSNGLIVFGAAIALSLTGCASTTYGTSTHDAENLDSEEYSDEEVPWTQDDVDLNSRVVASENYVQTVTVTLNNGDTVECVAFQSQFQCFPEALVPAAPR